ncbi:hypothetical protein HA402_007551 [Bradysia odoriphaga]|nr:hypothetical protein HA402_007551 [Bradysia odoriphaga]
MSKAIFLATLSFVLSLYQNVASAQNGMQCDKIDLIQFIEFPSEHKSCLQVAFEKDHEVSCVLKSLGLNSVFFKITSIQTLRNRNISSETGEKCETFLIFADSLADVKETFEHDHTEAKQFFPFSKLYLYIFDQFNGSSTGDIATATRLKLFLIENALFGYIFEYSNQKVLIRDLLTNDLKKSIVSYTPSDLFQPTVDTRLPKDDFRISLFNCAPYSFYSENASYNTKVNEIDGTEIRFVKEVTKNWKKIYNFRDFSQTKLSPYFLDSLFCVDTIHWIDICYSTIYTSRITSPSYEKPVDTVKQFLDHDMYICASYASKDFLNELRSSINEDDRRLGARSLVYGDNQRYRQRLIADRKCGLYANPLWRKYIVLRYDYKNLIHTFRLMKSCVSVQYSAFAFQKYCPYAKLFDWHIRRFQEHGLYAKLYSDMMIMGRVVLFDDTQEKSFHQITVVGVSGSFMLLSFGLVLSVVSFLVEIVIDRWHGSKHGYQAK